MALASREKSPKDAGYVVRALTALGAVLDDNAEIIEMVWKGTEDPGSSTFFKLYSV